MNQIDFTKTGGFPLDQDVLEFLQQSILLASQAAALGGKLAILSGCEQTGNSVANGYVAINGEILPFVGSALDNKVIIVEKRNELMYEDGEPREVEITRYATFGDDGVTNYLWTNFKRNTTEGVLARLERLERIAAPFTASGKGGMVLWNRPKSEIPAGWAEVVDWRGRLPMGYNPDEYEFNTVGKPGGSKNVKMKLENLVAHDHDMVKVQTQGSGSTSGWVYGASQGNTTTKTSKTGNADPEAMNVLNPFRIVIFIEYTGI